MVDLLKTVGLRFLFTGNPIWKNPFASVEKKINIKISDNI